jgi:hypothetical protein
MTLAIIGFLIGAALGARFKVLIDIPAIGLALLGTAGVGIVHGDPIGSVGLTMVLIATTLQLGYLAGVVLRAVLVSVACPMRPTRCRRYAQGPGAGGAACARLFDEIGFRLALLLRARIVILFGSVHSEFVIRRREEAREIPA